MLWYKMCYMKFLEAHFLSSTTFPSKLSELGHSQWVAVRRGAATIFIFRLLIVSRSLYIVTLDICLASCGVSTYIMSMIFNLRLKETTRGRLAGYGTLYRTRQFTSNIRVPVPARPSRRSVGLP